MKRTAIFVIALAGGLALSACGGAASVSAPAPPPSSVVAPAESASSSDEVQSTASQGDPAADLALNSELVALLQGDNAALQQLRQGSCYGEIPGRGTARVLYFDPFLDVQMIPPQGDASAAWREGFGEGHHEENPFAADLPVLELAVMDELDPSAPAVLRQDSLRQLFITDARITYSLLCAGLGQTPELIHSEAVYAGALTAEDWPLGNEPGSQITGGDWRADFSVEQLRLSVYFVQEGEEQVAYRAVLSEE